MSAAGKLLALATWPRVAVAVLLAALAVAGVRVAQLGDTMRSAVWCGALLLSFLGWGEIVQAWLSLGRRADAGLRAAWGIGLFVFVGGVASALHATSTRWLIAHVLVGVAIWAARTVIDAPAKVPRPPFAPSSVAFWVVGAVSLLAASLALLGWIAWQDFNYSDDLPLYFLLVKKVLEQGSLFDPFDARRMLTLGGHVYLQAAFVSVAPVYCLNALEPGLFTIVLVLSILGAFGSRAFRVADVVPLVATILLVFSLGDVRANTASLFSGVVVVLAMARTVHALREDARGAGDARGLVVLALLASAALAMRTSNGLPACVLVGVLLLSGFLSRELRPVKVLLIAGGIFSIAFLAFSLPWMLEMRRSNGTLLYPALGTGWASPGFSMLTQVRTPKEAFDSLVESFSYNRPVAGFAALLVAGFCATTTRGRDVLVALTLGSVLGIVLLAMMGSRYGAPLLARYSFAYLVPTLVVIVMTIGERRNEIASRWEWARDAFVLLALGYHLVSTRAFIASRWSGLATTAKVALTAGPPDAAGWNADTADYVDVQSKLAPGTRVAVATSEPFRFDCRRNEILSLDFLGGSGPPPGFPVFQGPEALDHYLRSQGVRYLVYTPFERRPSFHQRGAWLVDSIKKGSYIAVLARYVLDVERSIDALTPKKSVVYQSDLFVALDLGDHS